MSATADMVDDGDKVRNWAATPTFFVSERRQTCGPHALFSWLGAPPACGQVELQVTHLRSTLHVFPARVSSLISCPFCPVALSCALVFVHDMLTDTLGLPRTSLWAPLPSVPSKKIEKSKEPTALLTASGTVVHGVWQRLGHLYCSPFLRSLTDRAVSGKVLRGEWWEEGETLFLPQNGEIIECRSEKYVPNVVLANHFQ